MSDATHPSCAGAPSCAAAPSRAAVASRAAGAVTRLRAELERSNYAGRTVTLAEGAAVGAAVVVLTARRASAVDALALAGVAALGLADDIIEPRRRRAGEATAKGLRGHLGAFREGRLTTGGAKLIGIPVLCLGAAALAPRPRRLLLDGALAAGCANLANLLDLRPGRALKAVAAPALVLALLPGDVAADAGEQRDRSGRALALAALVPAVAALPADLREHGMLGDGGANVLGAAVGTALARRTSPLVRAGALAVIAGLTLASERVSFSAVIDASPWLRRIDGLGRRPVDGTRP